MKINKLAVFILGSMLLILIDPSVIKAQRSHFSFSFSPVLPLSDLKEHASWGFLSGNINYGFDLLNKLSWCCSVGYNRFGSQTVTFNVITGASYKSKLAYIPVTTGFQYFINNNKIRIIWLRKVAIIFLRQVLKKVIWELLQAPAC
jgi:hypothetical protein